MKTNLPRWTRLLGVSLATLLLTGGLPLLAQTDRAEGKKSGQRQLPPEVIEKFDADGDGQLNEEERQAAREARRANMLEKYDADGDGQLSDEEKAQLRADNPRKRKGPRKLPPEVVERFDADGDGQLNEEERQAARQARRAEMLEKYDADGDGQLSDEERAEARADNPRKRKGPKKGAGPDAQD
ncbi:MAG: hypothetical protein AAGK14_05450 [Verrucomicrobiota bacterium]